MDEGANDASDAQRALATLGVPSTYMVRTGHRFKKKAPTEPEFGVQVYFEGALGTGATVAIQAHVDIVG
jgi:hypothetical protein